MNLLLALIRWLHLLSLTLFIGGLFVIGAVVAPAAFRDSGLPPDVAGNVVGASLARFNLFAYVAGGLLVLAELTEITLMRRAPLWWKRLATLRLLGSAAVFGMAIYLGREMLPQMNLDRAAGRMDLFDAAHQTYERLSRIQAWLAIAVAFFSGFLSLPAREETPPGDGGITRVSGLPKTFR